MRPDPLATRMTFVPEIQPVPADRDPINPETLLRFLRTRWRLLGAWSAAGLCAALLLVAAAPAYYTAYTTFLFDSADSRPQGDLQAPGLAADPASYVFSQIELIQSDEVLERVIKGAKLTEDSEFGKPIGNIVTRVADWVRTDIFHLAEQEGAHQQQTMIRIRKALLVRRLGMSDAVEIGFTSRNPDLSAKIANLVAQSYVESKMDQRRRSQGAALAELRDRLAELRGKALAMTLPRQGPANPPGANEQAREQFRDLQDTTEAYRNLYSAFLQKEYMSPGAHSGGSPGRVITPAKPPFYKSSPRAVLALALGFGLGLAIGFCHALIRHTTEQVVSTPSELEPFVRADRIRKLPRQNWFSWKREHSENSWIQASYVKHSARLSDTLTKLIVRLQSSLGTDNGKIIGVVSTDPKAGSSTIAAHLAKVLGEANHATLLVDANWRKSVPASKITPVIESGGGPLYAEPAYLWHASTCASLLVLRAPQFTSDLAISAQIRDLLISRRNDDYRYIIVDFTSLAQSADLDACIDLVDHLILVAELGRTRLDTVRRTFRSIRPDLATDVLLNKA